MSRELKTTLGGIPIGFDDDASYVGGWQRRLVNAVMAVPGSVRRAPDIDAFRYETLRSLARSRNLRLISIWNPMYLSLLLDRLPERGDRICYDLTRRSREVRAALRADTPQEIYAWMQMPQAPRRNSPNCFLTAAFRAKD